MRASQKMTLIVVPVAQHDSRKYRVISYDIRLSDIGFPMLKLGILLAIIFFAFQRPFSIIPRFLGRIDRPPRRILKLRCNSERSALEVQKRLLNVG